MSRLFSICNSELNCPQDSKCTFHFQNLNSLCVWSEVLGPMDICFSRLHSQNVAREHVLMQKRQPRFLRWVVSIRMRYCYQFLEILKTSEMFQIQLEAKLQDILSPSDPSSMFMRSSCWSFEMLNCMVLKDVDVLVFVWMCVHCKAWILWRRVLRVHGNNRSLKSQLYECSGGYEVYDLPPA